MKSGMLWFDDSQRNLKVKVQEAAVYYQEKYGEKPTMCFVNPSMLAEKVNPSNGVEVKGSRIVMPGHLWVGVGKVKKGKTNGRAASTKSNGRTSPTEDES